MAPRSDWSRAPECEQSRLDRVEIARLVGRQHRALHDAEVDLDLVEAIGTDRQLDEMQVGEGALESPGRRFFAARGAVVDNAEDAAGFGMRRRGHHLRHQSAGAEGARY
jgi:hypothetical protein